MKGETKKQELRDRITEAGIGLIKAEGFDAASMEEIARRAGITKRTLYKYFPVKEALIEEFIRQKLSGSHDHRVERLRVLSGLGNRVSWYLRELMEGVLREPVLFERYIIYLMRTMVSLDREERKDAGGAADPAAFIITEGLKDGEIDSTLPVPLLSDLFLFAFVEITKTYYADPVHFEMDRSVETAVQIFTKGVCPCRA